MKGHFIIDIEEANKIIDFLKTFCRFGTFHEFELPCPVICPAKNYCEYKKEVERGEATANSG
jgi:hypothetical protein